MKWIRSTRSNPIQIRKLRSESSPIHVEQAESDPIQSSPEMLGIWRLQVAKQFILQQRYRDKPMTMDIFRQCLLKIFHIEKTNAY